METSAYRRIQKELTKAHIYDEEDIPYDVVRLNSKTTLVAPKWKKHIQLVLPSMSNDKLDKISIISPISLGTYGLFKGRSIKMAIPGSGYSTFYRAGRIIKYSYKIFRISLKLKSKKNGKYEHL